MKKLIFLVMICLSPAMVMAECPQYTPQPPTLVGVEVNAPVTKDGKGIYTYSYTIWNGVNSTGCIWWFEIDITKPSSGTSLPSTGLVDAENVSRGVQPETTPETIPVGFPYLPEISNIPEAWGAGLTVAGAARWSSDFREVRIAPGTSVSGFVLTSYGLPGIRGFMVEPKYNPPPVDDVTKAMLDELELILDRVSIRRKTIGPTAPPAVFHSLNFLDYLINLKHEAFSLGWIKNKGIEESLDAKLESAKAALQRGQPKTALNTLNALLNEVEAQRGKGLTSEAYGLLKYNVLYLMERL
jgi:hypothetical protein